MFKHADPTRRVPTYLQAHTKENLVWQLKLLGVFLSVMWAKDWWDERRQTQLRKQLSQTEK